MTDRPSPRKTGDTVETRLLNEGWERRFVAAGDQAQEAMALYQTLGFEVRAEPLRPSEPGLPCQDCQLAACTSYVVIYTRRSDAAPSESRGTA